MAKEYIIKKGGIIMGFLDNLKGFISTDGDDYNPIDNTNNEDIGNNQQDDNNFYSSSRYSSNSSSTQSGKYVNINGDSKLSVVLVKPESFSEASSIADHLNSKRTVVLNLESTNKDISRRLVDFLSGVAYANKGDLKRVANCTYIITPFNVDVMGDDGMLDDLSDNGGMYI